MDDEERLIRDVYAEFGVAMYFAQVVERGMIALLCTVAAPSLHVTRARVDDLMAEHDEHTFGQLLDALVRSGALQPDVLDELRRAKIARDHLAHRYWWDRAAQFANPDTRPRLIAELDARRALFQALAAKLDKLVCDWRHDRGIPQEEWEALIEQGELDLLVNAADEEPPPPPRRPQKTEELAGLYMYEAASGRALMFKFVDGTLWEPTDNGLVHHQDDVAPDRLRELHFSGLTFPIEIMPRPKRAKPWDYCIPLGAQYHVAFTPGLEGTEIPFHVRMARLDGGRCDACSARATG